VNTVMGGRGVTILPSPRIASQMIIMDVLSYPGYSTFRQDDCLVTSYALRTVKRCCYPRAG
ncbi:hypothetical protein Bpfe_022630, partial [Biomphalaria pfeifferi]